ncbi:MAG: hypothetical protein ACLTV1_03300 [Christensenellales bacterium]
MIDAVMDAAKVMRGELTKEDLVFKPEGDSIKGTRYIRPSAAQKVTGSWDFGATTRGSCPRARCGSP